MRHLGRRSQFRHNECARDQGGTSGMNILHISPTYYPATYFGGPIYSTLGLCNALAGIEGAVLRVLTTDSAGPHRSNKIEVVGMPSVFPAGYEVFYCRRRMGADISFEMFTYLSSMIAWADIVHLTAVYSPPTIPSLLISRIKRRPVVWSPRGSLQRWRGVTRPMAKHVWEAVCNTLVVPERCVLHVTSEEEARASANRIPKARTVLIPNGIDIPLAAKNRQWCPGGRLRVLYLGRLHPIKGIENLIAALPKLESTGVSLTICGEGDPAYKESLVRKTVELGVVDMVSFRGHVNGEAKTAAFTVADVCVVPSYVENFGMVVGEALAHGVPVIVSKGAPWAGIESHDCGLWVENTPDCLAAALKVIWKRDLADMGSRGRAWIEREFSWHKIADEIFSVYDGLL